MTVATDALITELTTGISSRHYLDGEMILTPWDLPDGRSLDLFVGEVADDWYLVSDRGLIADRLGDVGVDVSTKGAAKSWALIRRGLAVTMAEAGEFEIAVTTDRASLGRAISEIASRAMQGDGLRVLGRRPRQAGFAADLMREADSRLLGVAPDSLLGNKFGGKRQVSFLAEGPRGRCYVMALGRPGSFIDDHDRAKLAFDDADVSWGQRASIVGPDARPLPWHLESLREVSQVFEGDRDSLWDSLADAA